MVKPRDVLAMTQQPTPRAQLKSFGKPGQLLTQAAVADDDQSELLEGARKLCEGFHQQVESFLSLQAPDRSDDHLVATQSKFGSRTAGALSTSRRKVDGSIPLSKTVTRSGFGPAADQFILDIGRHGDHAGEAGKKSLADRVIEQTFAQRVAGPAMSRPERNHTGAPRQHQRQQVGLVVMRMDDIDATRLNQILQG